MAEKKSFTGWVERPAWERAALVLLIFGALVVFLVVLGQRS